MGRILDSTEGKEGRAHPADRVQEGRAVVGEQGKKENEVEQATAAAH